MTAKITPTEELMLDVLVARARLGDSAWTFNSHLTATAQRLADKDLASFKSGTTEGTILVWLTAAGRKEHLKPDYMSAAEFSTRERKRQRKALKAAGQPVPPYMRKRFDPEFEPSHAADIRTLLPTEGASHG